MNCVLPPTFPIYLSIDQLTNTLSHPVVTQCSEPHSVQTWHTKVDPTQVNQGIIKHPDVLL